MSWSNDRRRVPGSAPRALRVLAAALWLGAASVAHAADSSPATINELFPRPPELEPDVRFWERIYASVTTQGGLIHDDRHLSVVYEQIDFAPTLDPRSRQEAVEATRAKYQRILRELADAQNRDDLSAEQRRVLALWPADVDSATLRDAATHVRFQLGQADRFREGLIRSGAYESHIRDVMRREGLPDELAALPHVESSFNALARSKAGAAGMWQFMPSTGGRMMRVDGLVDERLDPYKSAGAAARFLSHAHQLLGSWPLALTAYNHGAAGMARAKNALGTDDIATILRRYQSPTFGFASRNFYVSFLAALEIDRSYEKFFGAVDRQARDASRAVTLPHYVPAKALAAAANTDLETLKRLNLALLDPVWRGERFVPRGFEFRVPPSAGTAEQVLARLSAADEYDAQRRDPVYRVARKDTLAQIAKRVGVSTGELVSINHLANERAIHKGMVLKLPEPKPIGVAHESPAAAAGPAPAVRVAAQ